jgi:hypothetical protein
MISSAVLYGSETWFLTVTEERRLKVYENGVLKRKCGPKREEVVERYIMRSFITCTLH